jgi:arsenite/tail-anchored protein-transporting ATPase
MSPAPAPAPPSGEAPSAPDRPAEDLPALGPVVLVTGKGGVGKTAIAAGLAEAAARRDGTAMLIEFGDGESGRRALRRGTKVIHRVVDPREAMLQAITNLLGSQILARLFLNNFAVRPMLRAAPAMRELAMLECVRIFADELPGKRIVVDMPATGHGLTWLRLPVQMRDMFASGAIHDLAARIVDRLISPSRSSVVVVTLPERLVLQETIELCHALETEVGLQVARVVVNRFPAELGKDAFDQAHALEKRGGPEGAAATELLRVIEARTSMRKEALEILKNNGKKSLTARPLILSERLEDPTADDVASWLEAERAQ